MANIKVSEMTEATSFDDGDYTMIVQANQNKKISKENMLSDIPTIQNNITTINNNIGDLSNLETDDKTSIVNSINELKSAEIYSTDEIKTNEVWIDGKPIYKKVIYVNSINCTSAGFKFVPHGISNLKNVIHCEYREQVATNRISESYTDEVFNSVITGISFNNENIRFYTNAWNVVSNWYFTIKYTKTTD